jgi:NAD(P)-dependent dehydrogenase (short-subunit alcohol dehydrogenase family)
MIAEPRLREAGQVALVTGANSGIGFEAAAQLAAKGFRKVVLGCRSLEKSKRAGLVLRERTGLDVFVPLEIDISSLQSVRSAAGRLPEVGAFDVLILNAGVLPGATLVHTADGIEQTAAVSLVGHHVLTTELLTQQLLSANARIVIAGSEGARGDAPGMKPTDVKAFARKHHSGNLDAAIRTLLTMQPPARHHWSTTYCTAKALVALWARALAPQLPRGVTVNAVSPGNVPGTNAARHQPWLFRVMLGAVSVLGPMLGLATPASVGARRYLDALDWGEDETGAFWASPKGKLVGALTKQAVPELSDQECAAACWRVLETLTSLA